MSGISACTSSGFERSTSLNFSEIFSPDPSSSDVNRSKIFIRAARVDSGSSAEIPVTTGNE